MIRKVIKYNLNFEKTKPYFISVLETGNILSSELLKIGDLKQGFFYTLLPEEAIIEKVYQFRYGGLIPPKDVGNKPVYLENLGKEFVPLEVQTLRAELTKFINNRLHINKKNVCLFEDMIKSPIDKHLELFKEIGLNYLNQIYYFIESKHANYKIISKSIYESEEIWHFLCILTEADVSDIKNQKLTLKKIKEICLNTKTIIVGAYDGEGYIFWERK